jgi:hypothetical protein
MTGPLVMGDGAGIHWGSLSSVTDPLDFSEGICLYGYGGASQFGFTITGGTLNYVVQSSGNHHVFRCGAAEQFRVGNGSTTVRGTLTVNNATTENFLRLSYGGGTPASQGALIEWMNADDSRKAYIGWGDSNTLLCQLDSASYFQIASGKLMVKEGAGIEFNSNLMFISSTANVNIRYDVAVGNEHSFWTGGAKRFYVNDSGGNLLGIDSAAADLNVAVDEDHGEAGGGGVSIGKMLVALVAKIKLLEAEIAALKGA